MGEQNDFFVTLMSDSSFKDHPCNTTASFTCELPRNINLEGEWHVAPVEIHYPQTVNNVTYGGNSFQIIGETNSGFGFTENFSLFHGFYASVPELVDAVNEALNQFYLMPVASTQVLKYSPEKRVHISGLKELQDIYHYIFTETVIRFKRLTVTYPSDDPHAKFNPGDRLTSFKLVFDEILARQLGLPTHLDMFKIGRRGGVCEVQIGSPASMLVYCDIIEPQIIGDSVSPVICIVPTTERDTRYGERAYRTFPSRNYVPLMKKSFQSVKIDIRGPTGELIPFAFGSCYVLLHFRKRLS
jgi:hypothetical protein